MVALAGLLGYRRTDMRELLVMLTFVAAFFYLLFVIMACVLPFIHMHPTTM